MGDPGTPGLAHRIGGLEKADGNGNISYDGANHERMTELRAAKVAGIADEIPPLAVDSDPGRPAGARLGIQRGGDPSRGSRARGAGHRVASAQLRHLNPLPANTGDVLRSFDRVLVPELQHRPAGAGAARRVPGRRRIVLQGEGQPLFAVEIAREIAERQ